MRRCDPLEAAVRFEQAKTCVMAPYWHGCNYPWSADGTTVYYGLDFGANIWGSHLGVSSRREAVQRDFDEMAALGFVAARWFVLTDGRSGILFDEGGFPSGLDGMFFTDLDAALEIAASAGIKLVLVMLDHRWMFRGVRDTIVDPTTGVIAEVRLPHGRDLVLRTEYGQDALIANVLAPIVQRYGSTGSRADLGRQVLAFELMNEPDFIIEEWESDVSSRVTRPVRFETFGSLVARFNALVHAWSGAFTTIGCARFHNLWVWDDDELGVDLLQLHSYPDTLWRQDRDVFGTSAAALGVRRPVVLGEFPGDGPNRHPAGKSPPGTTLDDYLEFAVSAGYRGGWPWSFSGTDAYGPLPRPALHRFAQRHPELVNPRVRVPSTD